MRTATQRLRSLSALAEMCAEPEVLVQLSGLSRLVVDAVRAGGMVLSCGNGGSAAQSAHLAGELLGRYRANREPLAACDLSSTAAVTSCIANDWTWEDVFARQIRALGCEGDVLVCLSTSGTSPNVVAAARAAWERKLWVVAITGSCEGRGLGAMPVDAHVMIPSTDTALIQEVTLSMLHSLCAEIDAVVTSAEK
jgi:Phosphoheptose isomerase